jgi:hypothetical protein
MTAIALGLDRTRLLDQPRADAADNDTPIALASCFCNGTRLLTDRGPIPVQRLAAGDRIVTADGTIREVRATSRHRLDLLRHAEAERMQPVLIRSGAIAPQVPQRDLYASPDQVVLLDEWLVPARLLVNGASISRDPARKAVTYYHVSLDTDGPHPPPTADAPPPGHAPASQSGAGLILHPDLATDQDRRQRPSARTIADTPALLEPLWQRLAQRASRLGFDLPAATDGPYLHLRFAQRTVSPTSRQDGHYVFVLPRAEGPVHIVSHAARPCDRRPWLEDRRRLGVLVTRLTLRRDDAVDLIPLDHPALADGWWPVEPDHPSPARWTNGDAVIPTPIQGPAILEITIANPPHGPIGQPALRSGAVTPVA